MKSEPHPSTAIVFTMELFTVPMMHAYHHPPRCGGTTAWIGALVALLALSGLAETPTSSLNSELDVEVLSVSVSRLAKDAFGNSMNPFNSFNPRETDAGTVVLAKITPRGTAPWEL